MTNTQTNAPDQAFAHVYKARGRHGYEVTITSTPHLACQIAVLWAAGKRDARKIAAEFNATPWNF